MVKRKEDAHITQSAAHSAKAEDNQALDHNAREQELALIKDEISYLKERIALLEAKVEQLSSTDKQADADDDLPLLSSLKASPTKYVSQAKPKCSQSNAADGKKHPTPVNATTLQELQEQLKADHQATADDHESNYGKGNSYIEQQVKGDVTYLYEVTKKWDPVKKIMVRDSMVGIGKIIKGSNEIIPCRPKAAHGKMNKPKGKK